MALESAPPAAPATPAPPIHPAAVQPAPVVETPAAPVVQVVPAPAAPLLPPGIVPVTQKQLEEYEGYKATVANMEADRQAAQSAAKEAELQAQMAKGQYTEALAQIRKANEDAVAAERNQRAMIEERAKKYALQKEVSQALASHNLVPGGAAQLADHWRDQFISEPAGDSYAVRTPQFQSVSDFVASQLAKQEYAHFLRSSTQGGVGINPAASTSAPAPQTVAAPPAEPKNFSEAIILQMQEIQKTASTTDPRLDLSRGMMKGIGQRA
jgi:hypothetical protein